MYHRFNQFVGVLRGSSQFEALLPTGLKGAQKRVENVNVVEKTYTPVIKHVNDLRASVISDQSGGNPHRWKSWKDIPDSMIPTTSGRDPNNQVYATRPYINLRKQQIWHQIDDGTPVYLKGGPVDYAMYYGIILSLVLLLATNSYYICTMMFAPKKKG